MWRRYITVYKNHWKRPRSPCDRDRKVRNYREPEESTSLYKACIYGGRPSRSAPFFCNCLSALPGKAVAIVICTHRPEAALRTLAACGQRQPLVSLDPNKHPCYMGTGTQIITRVTKKKSLHQLNTKLLICFFFFFFSFFPFWIKHRAHSENGTEADWVFNSALFVSL